MTYGLGDFPPRTAPRSRFPDSCVEPSTAPVLRNLILTITSRCNNRCIMCGYPSGRAAPDMPVGLISRVLADLADPLPRLVLTGGEPTLHPRFPEIVDRIGDYRSEVLLLTNGGHPAAEVMSRFVASRSIRRVLVSVHGGSEIHEQVTRTPHSFERARAGFHVWAETIRRDGNHQSPPSINMTLTRANFQSVAEVIRIAASWGAATLRLDPVSSTMAEWRSPALSSPATLVSLHDSWLHLAADLGVQLIDLTPYSLFSPQVCTVTHQTAIVATNGTVHPCIPAKGGFREPPCPGVGSLEHASLPAVWRSPAFASLRKAAFRRSFSFCSQCLPQHTVVTMHSPPCVTCPRTTECPMRSSPSLPEESRHA